MQIPVLVLMRVSYDGPDNGRIDDSIVKSLPLGRLYETTTDDEGNCDEETLLAFEYKALDDAIADLRLANANLVPQGYMVELVIAQHNCEAGR